LAGKIPAPVVLPTTRTFALHNFARRVEAPGVAFMVRGADLAFDNAFSRDAVAVVVNARKVPRG